jgi:hypothetical protein
MALPVESLNQVSHAQARLAIRQQHAAQQPAMLRVIAAVGIIATTVHAAGILPPTPPPMSGYQQSYVKGVSQRAAAASAAATPDLEAALDDPAFRKNLTLCCPNIASKTGAELLTWFQAQVGVSEMVHNFNAEPPAPGGHHGAGDPDLAVYANSTWFFNLWEPSVLNLTKQQAGGPEDAMEAGPFGMKEFRNGRSPSDLEEAQQRPVSFS